MLCSSFAFHHGCEGSPATWNSESVTPLFIYKLTQSWVCLYWQHKNRLIQVPSRKWEEGNAPALGETRWTEGRIQDTPWVLSILTVAETGASDFQALLIQWDQSQAYEDHGKVEQGENHLPLTPEHSPPKLHPRL